MPARLVGDQVWDVVDDVAGVETFRGLVGDVTVDAAGRVVNYAVLYDAPGHRSGSRVGSTRDRLAATFQVTCVGHDTATCLWTVDRITTALTGARVVPPGRTRAARITEDPSNRGQLVVVDEDFDPPRFYAPLLFNINT